MTAPEFRTPSATPTVTIASRASIVSSAETRWRSAWTTRRETGCRWISRTSAVCRFAAAVGEREDRVAAGAMDQLFEGVRVDGDVLGDRAVPVEHRRKLAGRAQRMCAGRAELLAVLDGKVELFIGHGFLYKRTR